MFFIYRIYMDGFEYIFYNSYWIIIGGVKVSGFKIVINFDFKFWIFFGYYYNFINIEKF